MDSCNDMPIADQLGDPLGCSPLKSYRENFCERDLTDHRQDFIGLRGPCRAVSLSNVSPTINRKRPKFSIRPFPRNRPPGGKKKQSDIGGGDCRQTDDESDYESPAGLGSTPTPAVERVKFILGNDQNDDVSENPELFTELDELFMYIDGNIEWKETARWYKYEEDVEEGGDRWTRPHVATLSLYSLFELRSSLMGGTVILDMDANNLLQIADLVIDSLISCNKLEEILRAKVRDTLLRRHRHQRTSGLRRGLSSIIGKKNPHTFITGGGSQLLNIGIQTLHGDSKSEDGNSVAVKVEAPSPLGQSQEAMQDLSQIDLAVSSAWPLESSLDKFVRNESVQGHLIYQQPKSPDAEEEAYEKAPGFMKKLPPNAEASNVLVGEVDFLDRPITAFVRLASSALLGDLTEIPVPTRFLFIMLGPVIAHGRYHEIGRAISTLLADEVFHKVAYKAKSRDDLIAGIDEFLEQVTVLPPGELDPSARIEPPNACKQSRRCNMEVRGQDSSLEKPSTGSDAGESSLGDSTVDYFTRRKCFLGGLIKDIQQRRLRYGDLRDALHVQCVGSVFFMYFFILAVVCTTGKHQELSTGGSLNTREYLLSYGLGGLIFVLCSGQPLSILCSTLPVIFFEELVYNCCTKYGLEFLPLRLWIGFWAVVCLLIFVAFDVSNFVGYATRFTVEIFIVVSAAALFTRGCVHVHSIFTEFPVLQGYSTNSSCLCVAGDGDLQMNVTVLLDVPFRDCVYRGGRLVGVMCSHDVYFLSLVLMTFTILLVGCVVLLRRSGFLPNKWRYSIDCFAVPVAVLIMSAVSCSFDVGLTFVNMPATFGVNSVSGRRSWVVSVLGSNDAWSVLIAFFPGILLALVLLVEQQVTGAVANQRGNLLKKGFGYHTDILALAVGVLISSILGLPFLVGSSVLTVNNIQNLKVADSRKYTCSFKGVREQRLTGAVVCLLLASSPLMMPALRFIPVPVLYGVVLYCCVRSLQGVQLVNRLLLMCMPRSNRPDIVYLRQVPLISANVYSLVQVCCVLILLAVRTTQAAIVFPIMIFLTFLVRLLLEYLLPLHDVHVLDEVMDKSCFLRAAMRTSISDHLLLVDGDPEKLAMSIDCVNYQIDGSQCIGLVNISEELSKTSAWRQICRADYSANSLCSSSPKVYPRAGRKRRSKKPRLYKNDTSLDVPCLDRARPCDSEGIDTEPDEDRGSSREDSLTESNQSPKGKCREGKDTNSKCSGRRKPSKPKRGKSLQSSNTEGPAVQESVPLPPWEQPYHSPPRIGFSLLKIPEDDVSVDPGFMRSVSDSVSRPLVECHPVIGNSELSCRPFDGTA